ncbi:MAG: hypothetical protein WCS69_01250 [Ignavibacteriaceae bacterium]|jgi:hypothetical protein
MEFETVNILVDEKQVKIIKNVVGALIQAKPQLRVTPFKYGTIGDNVLVNFKVDSDHHRFLIDKLASNGIHTINIDLKTKHQFDNAKLKAKTGGTTENYSFGSKSKTNEKKTLDQLINEGDYAEVIKISRDVTLPIEEIETAKSTIDATIQRAINNAYSEAEIKKTNIDKNIERLITIASDKNLKAMQKQDFIKQAGLFAIQICLHNNDYVGDLINICNNNMLQSIVNVKAAVSFYDAVIVNSDMYEEEVLIARRRLNTRWLLIAISSVEADLTDGEKESFYKLIDFISANRS